MNLYLGVITWLSLVIAGVSLAVAYRQVSLRKKDQAEFQTMLNHLQAEFKKLQEETNQLFSAKEQLDALKKSWD